jgi:G6PDH family F420-dependent oxidoreductase
MLEEAVDIIRMLWSGDNLNFKGKYYSIENTRIYTLPVKLPPILMSADGESAAETAGRLADGLITPGVREDLVKIFKRNCGEGKPCYAEASVCWADSEDYAKNISHEYWPIVANTNGLNWELPTPKYFEELAKMTDPETVTRQVVCGNDPQRHID